MCRNLKFNLNGHGGIFSKVMGAIQCIEKENIDINNCYVDILDDLALNDVKFNPLNYIINQDLCESHNIVDSYYSVSYCSKNRIDNSILFPRLKKTVDQLTYHDWFLKLVSDNLKKLKIDETTIGVHIRLSDMNQKHSSQYGIKKFDDFLSKIEEEFTSDNKIFVASDNDESIEKLIKIYGSYVNYVPNLTRVNTEDGDSYNLQLNNLNKKELWVDAFLEMLLLSKCGKLICRTSNLANMSILSSNTFKKIIMI